MVDSYLDLRRLLTRQLGTCRSELLDPHSHFHDWRCCSIRATRLHTARRHLRRPAQRDAGMDRRARRMARSRPTARRSASASCCACARATCSSTSSACCRTCAGSSSRPRTRCRCTSRRCRNRTNSIMRTLTVLTAIFLPLNLITGIFGMNFDALPLIHSATGVWVAFGMMAVVGIGLGLFFWRKRYLARTRPLRRSLCARTGRRSRAHRSTSVSRASIAARIARRARGPSPARAARRAPAGARSARPASMPCSRASRSTTGAHSTRSATTTGSRLVVEGQHVGRVVLARGTRG